MYNYKTINLAKIKNSDLTVNLTQIDKEVQKHYSVDLDGKMSFKFGWSEDVNFLDVKNNKYVKTTKDDITAMLGNGMSGTASLFFAYKDIDKVLKKLHGIGWQPKMI